jgi:hypothetical protein
MNALTRAGKRTTFLGTGIVMAIIVLLCAHLNSMITDAPVMDDGLQNLQSAYNLKTWGVFSRERVAGTPSPDNYREPLPPAVTAAFMCLLGDARACLNGDCISQRFDVRTIKKINIGWAFIALCASAVLSYRLTGSRWATVLVLLMIHYSFLRNPAYIDSLYTEIPASACMLVSALCVMACIRKPAPHLCLLTGIMLGLLALVKAIFLYSLVPVVLLLLLFLILHARKTSAGNPIRGFVMLCLGVLITVTPWIVRNTIHFGSAQISSRGGLALYTRALVNQMDPYEYGASFHYWGPGAYRRLVQSSVLDIGDKEYEPGGRAVRLNSSDRSGFVQDDIAAQKEGRPEDVLSFYRRARAQRVKVSMDLRQVGAPIVENTADAHLRETALAMILQHPFRHVLATVPLAWRGMWCFYGGGVFTMLCAVAYGSFIFVCFYGVVQKRWDILVLQAVPFSLVLFNAFLTNNLPRFNAPAIPFMIMSMVFAAQFAVQYLSHRFKVRGGNHDG